MGVLAAAMAIPACADAQSCPQPLTPGQATGPMADVRWLADDALEGRGVGTEGGLCATAYLAARFDALGLEPGAAGGSWLQSFPLRVGSQLTGLSRLDIGRRPIDLGSGWAPFGFSGSGNVEAPLVYAGSGVNTPGSPPPPPVDGMIVVVEAGTPGASGLYSDPHFKGTVSVGRGARGVVLLLPDGAPLPSVAGETRPFLGAPVVAVAGSAAAAVREAARAGETGRLEVRVEPLNAQVSNVIALLPGSDPALRDEVVVVGAHFDHLGRGGEGSMDPDSRSIHNGADDNASGTAGILEMARLLAAGPRPARSVLFIGFNGEERGLLGSAHYVANPARPLASTVAMINLDMVGRLRANTLTVYGLGTAPEWNGVLDGANPVSGPALTLSKLADGYGPSDHASFYGRGIPVLHFFTNTHTEYHRPSDDWETVNGPGIERIAAFGAEVVRRVVGTAGTPPVTPTLVQTQPAAPPGGATAAAGTGYGPYFGSIPDMAPMEHGVRITGVREDSPAARAGLQAGDVIVEFDGKDIADLYAFTYALREKAVGDAVAVVVLRDGKRVTVRAVLGERP